MLFGCLSSLVKYLFTSSAYLLIFFFFFWYWPAWVVWILRRLRNHLPVTSFANTFSHSLGCLSILFMVSFAVQNLFSLISSHLFIFVFIFITLRGGLKKILLQFMSKCVLPLFSSKSFIVSSHISRSLIHFEFIFLCGVREYSNFILL